MTLVSLVRSQVVARLKRCASVRLPPLPLFLFFPEKQNIIFSARSTKYVFLSFLPNISPSTTEEKKRRVLSEPKIFVKNDPNIREDFGEKANDQNVDTRSYYLNGCTTAISLLSFKAIQSPRQGHSKIAFVAYPESVVTAQ